MKRRIAPALALALMLSLGARAAAPAGAVTLRMNHQFPKTAAGSGIDQWFADEVAKASDGELKIKIYWAGALGGAKENLTLLRNGAIDMAAMSAGYFPSDLPLFSAPNSIPMAMNNIRQASAIMKALVEEVPAYMEEAKSNNIRPLFFHLLNPYLLVTREPVTSLEDLQGLKIRTWGEDMPRLMRAAGAVPVTIFLPELYENLQRGVIDGCPFSVDLTVTYKIYEVAPHITEVVVWEGPAWGIWVSQKTWRELSREHRRILTDTAERARARELEHTARAEREARKTLKARGVTFHSFPEKDLERWREAAPDFFADWIAKMEKRGKGDAARRAVEIWKRLRREIP
jgi:TRAP-type C4-dicarboxylate transport system substrate-binding protein